MSRIANRPVRVQTDGWGKPIAVVLCTPYPPEPEAVLDVGRMHREWMGALHGEPERDVWQVRIGSGICELHCLRRYTFGGKGKAEVAGERWILYRWMD